MPCRDYESDGWGRSTGPSYRAEMEQFKERADLLARIACKVMTAYEAGVPIDVLMKDFEVSAWWKFHKVEDAKRMAAEKKAAEKAAAIKAARKVALAKLSPEEIEALGIKKRTKR